MGGPGRDLGDRLIAAGFQADNGGYYDDYDFVATMRSVIWTVAGVVLGSTAHPNDARRSSRSSWWVSGSARSRRPPT